MAPSRNKAHDQCGLMQLHGSSVVWQRHGMAVLVAITYHRRQLKRDAMMST